MCTKRLKSTADGTEVRKTLHLVQQFVYAGDAAKQWELLIGLNGLLSLHTEGLALVATRASIKTCQKHFDKIPITIWGGKKKR